MALTSSIAEAEVIVVGAGPAGLALAIELASRSVPCQVIEKNEGIGSAPRAKLTNVRTAELLRRWGIADKLAEAAPFGIDYPSNILFVTRLGGPLIARIENAFACQPGRDPRYSAHGQWIPQYKLEAVLLDHLRSLPGVKISFGEELIGINQDSASVQASIRNAGTGDIRSVTARYLVGADGARSTVRTQIGVKMKGVYGLSRNYNTIFEAPGLASKHRHGPGVIIWQLNKDVPSVIGPMDVGDRWYFMPTGVAENAAFKPEHMADLIRLSTGIDDVPYRVLSSDEWVASRLLADRYSAGRVYLIGDACHLHPPYGGHGMNMGVADGVDLGWKLAAVLHGWAGAALLDTYEIERRPVHEVVMEDALAHHGMSPNQLIREGIEDEGPEGEATRQKLARMILANKQSQFHSLGVTLGNRYRGSPTIAAEETAAPTQTSHEYVPSAAPGCLAPHRWLPDGRSLYDVFGAGFTLIVLDPRCHEQALETLARARRLGIPLDLVELADDALRALYEAPLTLVRPDQHVAWRGTNLPIDLLEKVTARP